MGDFSNNNGKHHKLPSWGEVGGAVLATYSHDVRLQEAAKKTGGAAPKWAKSGDLCGANI